MSHTDSCPKWQCDECGWKGNEPKELEHPRNEFPIMFVCPVCGEEVEPSEDAAPP